MNSYQILKKENEKLRNELFTVCCSPDCIEAMEIKMEMRLLKSYRDRQEKETNDLHNLIKLMNGEIKLNGILKYTEPPTN
jgi:hypothetical protein